MFLIHFLHATKYTIFFLMKHLQYFWFSLLQAYTREKCQDGCWETFHSCEAQPSLQSWLNRQPTNRNLRSAKWRNVFLRRVGGLYVKSCSVRLKNNNIWKTSWATAQFNENKQSVHYRPEVEQMESPGNLACIQRLLAISRTGSMPMDRLQITRDQVWWSQLTTVVSGCYTCSPT